MRSANMHRWPQIARKQLETNVSSVDGWQGRKEKRGGLTSEIFWAELKLRQVEHTVTMRAFELKQMVSHNANINTVNMNWHSWYMSANIITKTNRGGSGPGCWLKWTGAEAFKTCEQCDIPYRFVSARCWPSSLMISSHYVCRRQRHAFYTYSLSLRVVWGVYFDLSIYLPLKPTGLQSATVISVCFSWQHNAARSF